MNTDVHLFSYDIGDPKRLQRVGRAVRPWKACGQKSVAECWLTGSQRQVLLATLETLIERTQDRLLVLRLDPRQEVVLFGRASRPAKGAFVIT